MANQLNVFDVQYLWRQEIAEASDVHAHQIIYIAKNMADVQVLEMKRIYANYSVICK